MKLSTTTTFTPMKNNQIKNFSRTTPLTKTTRNMSDFTPIQQFQKIFSKIDKLFLKFRQMNPPDDFIQLIDDFYDLKSKYTIFIENCNRIDRHIKVGNTKSSKNSTPNEKLIENARKICTAFPNETSRFFSYFYHVNSKLSRFFIQDFQNYFTIMENSFHDYGDLCLKEQQTRYIYLQFESTIQELFASVRQGLNSTFSSFDEIQDVSPVVENLKLLSRKFESELPHSIHNQRLMLNEGNEYLSQFHTCFVLIVPLLANIPVFNQIFIEISEQVDPLQEVLVTLLQELKIDVPHIMKTHEIQNSVNSEDLFHITPQDHFIKEMAAYFGASDGSELEQKEWYDEIMSKAREKINSLKQKNHQLTTQLKSNDQITSEKALNDRIEENRKYKEKVQQECEERRIELMRNVINSIKVLVPYDLIVSSDDFETQINCIISNAQLEQKVLKENLDDANEIIQQTFNILSSYMTSQLSMNVTEKTSLPSLAELFIEKVSKKKKKEEEDQNSTDQNSNSSELDIFLRKFLAKQQINAASMNTSEMKKEVKTLVSTLKFKLNEKESKLTILTETSTEFEEKSIEAFSKIQRSLALFNNVEPLVSDVTFESVTSSIFSLLDETNKTHQNQSNFRNFLSSFLAQLLHALHLKQPKFRDMSESQLKDVMTMILDAPQIQKNLTVGTVKYKNASPRAIRPIEPFSSPASSLNLPGRPNTKEADSQFVLKMHAYLCDCLALLKGLAPVKFLHTPIEKLMQDVTKMIYEKNDCLQNYRGLLADVFIRVSRKTIIFNSKSNSKEKEELMKEEIGKVASGIFTSIEELLSKNERDIKEKLIRMVNLIPHDDQKQFSMMKLKPVEMVSAELEKMKKSEESVTQIVQTIDELSKDLQKERIGFVPVSPFFRHYLEHIENLRRSSIRLSPQETHPAVYLFATKMISLVDSFSNALSALSITENIAEKNKELMEKLANQKEFDDKINDLNNVIKQKKDEIEKLRNQLRSFVDANRKRWDKQIELINDIHEKEIKQIIEYYEQKQDF